MINNNYRLYSPSFQAKYLKSEALRMIAEYAVEHGEFEKLNKARKSIDIDDLQTRLKVDIGDNNGKPYIYFSKYRPKRWIAIPKVMSDLNLEKVSFFQSETSCNPLEFALQQIIKLGQDAPNNQMYQHVVIKR